MPFIKGQSGNPAGGMSKRRRLRITLAELKSPKDIDGLAVVATIAGHREVPIPMRLQAGIILAQYQHSKPTRRISKPFDLPVSETVEQATATIAKIGALAAAGEIGLDEANDLVGYQKAYIEAKTGTDVEVQMAELREVVQKLAAGSRAIDVTVFGGLGKLPGTDILMPALRPADEDTPEGGGP